MSLIHITCSQSYLPSPYLHLTRMYSRLCSFLVSSARISQALLHPATCHPGLSVPQPWPCSPLIPLSWCSRDFCTGPSRWREQCKAAGCCGQRTALLLLLLWKSDLPAAALHAEGGSSKISLPAGPQSATEEGPAAAVLHAAGRRRRRRGRGR